MSSIERRRFFLDTEFIEDGRTIDLLSIALVSDTGQELYLQNQQAPFYRANRFVADHVIPRLLPCPDNLNPGALSSFPHTALVSSMHQTHKDCAWHPLANIRSLVQTFVALESGELKPEFVTWYGDYDWVALCQLFGSMSDLPDGWPMYAVDLKQWVDTVGNPRLPSKPKNEHNALADARWNRQIYEWLEIDRMQALLQELPRNRAGLPQIEEVRFD